MNAYSINPVDGRMIREYNLISMEDAEKELLILHRGFAEWRSRPIRDRGALVRRLSDVLLNGKKDFARLMTMEMGKPINQAEAEVEKCAWVCRFYAEEGEKFLQPETAETGARESFVRFDPLGVILAVMPWNYPFWQIFRCAAPALMAGNVIAMKHASNICGCALQIEAVFRQAGFPDGTFRTLLTDGDTARRLIASPLVQAVTLTGSEAAGKSVAEAAGKSLKKIVLELGGSDPFIVFADADMNKCLEAAVQARMVNNGQSCIAAKRFILVDAVADRFVARLREKFSYLKMGDPLDEKNDVGPLAREDLVVEIHRQVEESVKMGAEALIGGKRPDGPGFFYPPTLLDGVAKGMPAYDEELFGPVASIIRVKDEEEALAVANDTSFGLGASLWTADREKAKRMAERIDSGMVFVNAIVKSDPRLPFGGVKNSGYGRELSGFGIREFVNIKTVWID